MHVVDPRKVVEGYEKILDRDGVWPNFHDAEVIDLQLWRGNVDPDREKYTFPQITAKVELCALEHPFMVTLKFLDCTSVMLSGFNHQNPIMDLRFLLEKRGMMTDGQPMPPYIVVEFVPCLEFSLFLKCSGVQVINVDRP